MREKAFLQKSFTPTGPISSISMGSYYLCETDDKFRRRYEVKTTPNFEPVRSLDPRRIDLDAIDHLDLPSVGLTPAQSRDHRTDDDILEEVNGYHPVTSEYSTRH